MMILGLFAMFDTTRVEIEKEHQLLMVSKTTSLEGQGQKGYFMKQQVICCSSEESQRLNPNPRLSASVMRGTVTEAVLP